tara:strand:- start:19199 stop:19642 length:444 start_codon:yes stop_codon:yes gene_type:complete
MNSIFQKQQRFVGALEKTLMAELERTINEFGFVLKDFVTNKQLFREGIDGDGEKLEGYKRTTIRIKLRKGDPVDRTTLRDEGDFHNSITIDAFPERFEVSSNVTHDKYIIERYGSSVLKITNENFREFMENYFIQNLKKQINGRFAK